MDTAPAMSDDTLIYPALIGQDLQQDVSELQRGGVLVIEELPFLEGGSMGSHGFLDYSVIAPIDAFFDQRPDRGVHEFWLTLDDEKQADIIKQQLDTRLKEYLDAKQATGEYTGARKIKVLTRRQYLASAQEYLGYGWLLQVAVSMVGVLIAVTASMNTMLMSTYERLGEYATLRAVGASRRVISMTILYEATFLNVTGGVIGLLFGTLATGVLDKAVGLLLEIPYPMAGITPMLLLQALGLSFCVGIIGAVIPCFIVSRIDLVEQLRKGL
jgi:ABC-type antimicrobial peptide transport system permease subunit